MPLSEKRLAANRANAAKSTGPTTLPGKRNSSRNAVRHGILADTILIEGESRERFTALLNAVYSEFQPETPTEYAIVDKIAVSQWRHTRLWAIEAAGITHEIRRLSNAMADENTPTRAMLAISSLGNNGRYLDLMSRYEHRFDRQHYRAIEGLRKLRAARIPPGSPSPESEREPEKDLPEPEKDVPENGELHRRRMSLDRGNDQANEPSTDDK